MNSGRPSLGTFEKSEVTREEVASMMAGGEDMENLSAKMAEFERIDREETGRDGDHLAEALYEEPDSIHEDENRGRETT